MKNKAFFIIFTKTFNEANNWEKKLRALKMQNIY